MRFSKFERIETVVEAVEITESNMMDVCRIVGYAVVNKVARSNGVHYKTIMLNPKLARSGKKSNAYVGDWLIKCSDGKYKVYGNTRFRQKYIVPE